ncbi:NUDIX domain-containing protein [Paenibacillus sp. PK3_47]|uniref:NUDIX domain-containing protein n=1 Tax=Paenibacillus sp. PK3_47 TaxID=2072642 RepID=UPI00201E1E91|nr:NUDIX domain-containing protein [Paenibacillus sp. PK3_47]
MVRLRQLAVAFLLNDRMEMLFLQKKAESAFLPGYLVPVGGHMEEGEFNDPLRACIREIKEETGLPEQAVHNLSLRYIVHRIRSNREIRIQYVYTGHVPPESVPAGSDEGQLLWVDRNRLDSRQITASTKAIIDHYFAKGIHNKQIYTGTLYAQKGQAVMGWSVLEDWEA